VNEENSQSSTEGGKESGNQATRKRFGQIVKKLRNIRGKTQCELAVNVGMDSGYLSRIENGHRNPPNAMKVKKLAQSLGVSERFLFMAAGYLELTEEGLPVTDKYLKQRIAQEVLPIE